MDYIDRIADSLRADPTLENDLRSLLGGPPPEPEPDVVVTGLMPGGFTVPAGKTWEVVGTIETDANVIVEGTLRMRGSGDMENPTTLRFIDIDEEAFIGGGLAPIDSDVGLWPVGDGLLDFIGTKRTRWCRGVLPADWEAADEMLICPHLPGDYGFDGLEAYALGDPIPTSTLGDGSVISTEVINLSCDVVVEGTPSGRTHITILSDAVQTMKWFCARHTGPRQTVFVVDDDGNVVLDDDGNPKVHSSISAFVPGRRALHFHMRGDATRGSLVEGVLVRDSGGEGCFVPHKSHGIVFDWCLAFNVNEDPFFWDSRAPKGMFDHLPSRKERAAAARAFTTSNDITWRRSGAVLLKPIPRFRGFTLSGFFLGRGTGDVVDDCFTAANQGGKRASGITWPSSANSGPNVWTVGKFVSHNGRGCGIFTWQNTGEGPHFIPDVVLYNHTKSGIFHGAYGASKYQYRPQITRMDQAGLSLHAVAKNKDGEGFRDDGYTLSFEGGYIHDVTVGVTIGNHRFSPLRPTLVVGMPFTAVAEAIVRINERGRPGWTDFVDCTVEGEPLAPDDVEIVLLVGPWRVTRRRISTDLLIPGSTIRIQNGSDEAFQLNHDGAWVSVAPFYPLEDPDALGYQAPGPVVEIPKETEA